MIFDQFGDEYLLDISNSSSQSLHCWLFPMHFFISQLNTLQLKRQLKKQQPPRLPQQHRKQQQKNRLVNILFAEKPIRSNSSSSSGLGCFHEHTQITLADGSTRSLNALHTGDEVLVHSSSGQFHPSRVLTVFHHQRSSVRFLDLYTTENSQPLRLTPSHSILTKNGYDFASNLLVGDWLISSEFQSIQITKIEEIVLVNQTISTPLTFEGNIIANNLIASCYATFNHQSMHWITTPIRYWYQIERFSRWNSYLVHLIDFYSMI